MKISSNAFIKLSDNKKELMFAELSSLLSAGLDFSHSFELLIETEEKTKHKQFLQKIYQEVVQGKTLHNSIRSTASFSALDCGVIYIGEETGRLNDSLDFLANYYHKKIEQKRMLYSAIRYPLIILAMTIMVVIFMLLVIVPMFETVYARMNGELPAMTRFVISTSKKLPLISFFIISTGLIGGYLLYSKRDNNSVRKAISKFVLFIPFVNKVVRRNMQAHFCKLLYLLISSGVPLLSGIETLKDILTFYPYQQSLKRMELGLQRGELLSNSLQKFPHLYEQKLVTLLRVGEETNRLPEMLEKQSTSLTHELEYELQKLGSFLEPILIFIVGVMVAAVLISMYLPMFKLGGIMG